MLVVDLFSGSGAATKAFKDRGHKVITVDIDPKLKPDVVADIRYFPLRNLRPDFVWASPPCTQFSNACHKNWIRQREGGWPEEGFETLAAACDAIASLNPPYWAIENVRGATRWWGSPTKRVGPSTNKANAPYLLWGRLPIFNPIVPWKWQTSGSHKVYRKHPETGTSSRPYGYSGVSASKRARIPYALSLALCCALERDLL